MLRADVAAGAQGFCLKATLEFSPGWHVILGSNGSGKSTLLRLLAGSAKADQGQVTWRGICVFANIDYYYGLGYLPQDFRAHWGMTIMGFLDYLGRRKLIPQALLAKRIKVLLEELDLSPWAGAKTETLSVGGRQRLGLAQALLSDPQVLILDEPTMGLDPGERVRFLEQLGHLAENRTVVMASNYPQEANERCDTVTVLQEGRVLTTGNASSLCASLRGRLWQCSAKSSDALVLEQIATRQGWSSIVVADSPPPGATALEPGLQHYYRWLKITSSGK